MFVSSHYSSLTNLVIMDWFKSLYYSLPPVIGPTINPSVITAKSSPPLYSGDSLPCYTFLLFDVPRETCSSMSILAKRTFVLTSRPLSRLTCAKTTARHHISRRFSVPATPSYVSTNKATVPELEILEKPQLFPNDGFEPILTNSLIEEEMLPGYQADQYYPVRLGEVLGHRYQAFAKVGLGAQQPFG